MYKIVFATHNQNKTNEIKLILSKYDIEVLSLNDINVSYKEPIEDGETYQENSQIKAKEARKFTNLPVFADDSGIEFKGLDNKPGIYSARFMDEHNGKEKTLKYVINELKNKSKEAAFFCNICLIEADGNITNHLGICKGTISSKIKGEKGFGYDPIFIPNGYEKTFAELGNEIKNQISHRSLAVLAMAKYLKGKNLI